MIKLPPAECALSAPWEQAFDHPACCQKPEAWPACAGITGETKALCCCCCVAAAAAAAAASCCSLRAVPPWILWTPAFA